ncbi:MAG: HNH endonuclease signature motif containing protein [Caldilineaceae bacterium]
MTRTLRILVESRADGRCEYCRRWQEPLGAIYFEIEHIVPESQGGLTVGENLAFACRHCNAYKAAATEAVDPGSGHIVRLFHPRLDNCSDHFERSPDQLLILGRTPIGRATVMRLRFNDASEQRARAIHRD